MLRHSKRLAWYIIAMVLAFPATELRAQARPPAPAPAPARVVITGVKANVDLSGYRGPCPAKLIFTATIIAATIPRGPVTYQWIRSDGVKGPKRSVKMTGATVLVTDTWQLGRPGEQMRVWKKLQVLTPNAVTSNQAESAILCG